MTRQEGKSMSIKIHSGLLLSRYTDYRKIIEVEGNTVLECLRSLAAAFPQLELFDKNGKLIDYFGIYLNNMNVFTEKLDTPVKDGDEISIVIMIEGG